MEVGEVEDEGRIVPQLKIGADGSTPRYMYTMEVYNCYTN